MPAELHIDGRWAEVRLAGDLDAVAVEDVASLVTTAVRTPGVTDLIMDVGGVTFCDSMGLSILIAAHNACHDSGLTYTLSNPTQRLRRLMEITGLTETFKIAP